MRAATGRRVSARALAALAAAICLASAAGALGAASARAEVPITSFTTETSTTQAGGHPDLTTSFTFPDRFTGTPTECDCNDPKDIRISTPAGVTPDPRAVPYCSRVDFGAHTCSPTTQIGVVRISVYGARQPDGEPLYSLEPSANQVGLLGFYQPFVNAPLFTVISSRTGGDYGLDLNIEGIEQIIPPIGISTTVWGVPAARSHDAERAPVGGGQCGFGPYPCGFPPNLSDAEPTPFLDNPTTCGAQLTSSLEIQAYDGSASTAEAPYPATTGCDSLSFNPSLYAQPTATTTDSPSGLDTDLSVPQSVSPSTPSPSEIHTLRVTLPEGMSINPNAADGKATCSDQQAKIGKFSSAEEAECPEDATIGTSRIASTELPAPISGHVYLGEPKPGERFRLILTADGYATHVKLAGSVEPDPQTGQLTVNFPNLPQSPISEVDLHIFGAERGLLATPAQCDTYAVQSAFTPWDSALAQQSSTQYFTLDSGPDGASCPNGPRPFGPSLEAGVADSTAGTHTPFALELSRPDGDQNLAGLSVVTPPGLLATLAGIPYCPEASIEAAASPLRAGLAEQASPSCPAASQVGASIAAAGAGTHPVSLPGKVYLAGPYKGAPLSLVVITPAVSGPYDLGDVVVRAALEMNAETAQITAVSDPLPLIHEGILLRLRQIDIELDRQGFTLSPTNCSPFSVGATVSGDEGAAANVSVPFQVANCASLPYKPKLSLKLSGGLNRLGHPAIHSVLTTMPGEANSSMVSVALPKGEILDNAHINSPCTRVELNAETCPPGSVLGHAVAVTPLLEKPLEGPVYLTTGFGHQLPDLIADLKGQIHIQLDGKVDTDKQGGIRTTFQTIPDAPVTKFTLSLDGGDKGLLENSEPVCQRPQLATAILDGQNGAVERGHPRLQAACARKGRHAKHRRARISRTREVG